MPTETENTASTGKLSDAEWLALTSCILKVNQSATHEDLRYHTLKALRNLVPFQSAAFFVADRARKSLAGCLIAQPVGTDLSASDFERCVDSAWRARCAHNEQAANAPVFEPEPNRAGASGGALCGLGPSLLACFSIGESGPLGALILSRTDDQGPFSERDRFVLETLEPHLTLRLEATRSSGGGGTLRTDPLREEYQLTKRELDVACCVAYGMTVPEIAIKLTISTATAKKHLENIYRKVGVNNRMSLMRFVQQYMVRE